MFADLTMISGPTKGRSRFFYPKIGRRRKVQPDLVLSALALNLANSAMAVRRLCCFGLDAQARHLVRQFAELGDTTVAIASDEDFFERYVSGPLGDLDHTWHWRKYLNPAIARRRLLASLASFGLEESARVEIQGILEDNYRWLSSFSHAR